MGNNLGFNPEDLKNMRVAVAPSQNDLMKEIMFSFVINATFQTMDNVIRIMQFDRTKYLEKLISDWKKNFLQAQESMFRQTARPADILMIGDFMRDMNKMVDQIESAVRTMLHVPKQPEVENPE